MRRSLLFLALALTFVLAVLLPARPLRSTAHVKESV